jgi:small nuclear ribonucleoprotein (snRNP)-like protein
VVLGIEMNGREFRLNFFARFDMIVEKYLGRKLRVKVKDGRQFEGTLKCIDNEANLILALVTESSGSTQRPMGNILIPGHELVNIMGEQLPATRNHGQ